MIRGPNCQKLYSQTAGSQSQVNTVSKTLHFAVTGKLRQKNVPINAKKTPCIARWGNSEF